MLVDERKEGSEITPVAIAELTRLYDAGLYVQACAFADTLPPVAEWRGTDALLIAGRLAHNVYAPQLGRRMHVLAWRTARNSPEAAYFYASLILHRRGPFAAWQFLRRLPDFNDAPGVRLADLLTLRAHVVSLFRDFETATALLAEAELLNPQRLWFWVEKANLHERQDDYPGALAATQRALEINPSYRPALQTAAHQLQLLGRDDEALALLTEAVSKLESAAIAQQLAVLQNELGQHKESRESWEKVRAWAPWMEPAIVEWWEARISDARYFCGDLGGAADAASRVKSPFYEELADRLKQPAPEARRVVLPVGFVRQHHFTCAPATLSALSRYWEMPVDHEALAAAICYDGTPDHIERHWAEENGWLAREFTVSWEILVALIDRGVPFTLATVETQSAHLQAVIGYDSFRRTLLIRDPYERLQGEYSAKEFFERYAASGPRGMVLVPLAQASRLDGLELPDATLFDEHYRVQRALHHYDRPAAERHLAFLEAADSTHRLTLQARRQLAWYDGSLPRQLEAVEALLVKFPKNGNFLWSKLIALRELTRRADYQEFLRDLAAQPDSEALFWREWAGELSQDARQSHQARRMLLRAVRVRPLEPENLHALAQLHWARREFAEATDLYRLAACLRDKIEHFSRSYFLAARHVRQTDSALAILESRAKQFGPQSCQPAKLLFWALTTLDRHTAAFEALEAALALRPEDGDLALFAADSYARSGDATRADSLLAVAEKRSSRIGWLRTAANLADYRCDLPRSLGYWRELLEEEPLALDAHRSVTRLLAETEGRTTALTHLRETCSRFSHHVGLYELWAEWARGDGLSAEEPILRELLALNPDHAWARREIALVLNSQRKFPEAFAELDLAERLEPHAPAAAGIRAQVALSAGDFAAARRHCQEALRLSIDHDPAIHVLLEASRSFEEKRAAVEFLRGELIQQVVYGDGLLAYRQVAFEIVEPPELLVSLREALAARPDLWHAWSAVVLQLIDMQRFDEALALATQSTERFPLLPRVWVDLAQVFQARGESDAQIAPLRKALQLAPGWGFASRHLAAAHERLSHYEDSVRVLEQAIAATPLDAYNHGCLADALNRLQRRPEAIQRLEHALRLEPGYTWAWDALRNWSPEAGEKNHAVVLARELTVLRAGEARSWYLLGQSLSSAPLAEILSALDEAVRLDPRLLDAHDFRVQLLAQAGQFDEAIAACKPPAFADETPTALRGRAAWVEAQRGNLRLAIAKMREVVADAPDYYWGWNLLADWLLEDRNFEQAREAVERMTRLAPRNAIPLGYLADVQLKMGEEEAAYATLQRAYRLDPTYSFAGYTLLDWHLSKGELDLAGQLLQTISTHLPGARAIAAKVRMECLHARKESALEIFRRLCLEPAEGDGSLGLAVKALVDTGWARDAEQALASSLTVPGANPEVGALWVQRFTKRGAWKHRKQVFELDPSGAIGRRTRIAYIEALGDEGKLRPLKRGIRRERRWLQSDPQAWGTVAYAFVTLQQHKDAIRWMADWRIRVGIEPWMLVNLANSLREVGRDREAAEVSAKALTLPHDHTATQHRLWVALEAALAGECERSAEQLAEVRKHGMSAFERTLDAMVRAVVAVFATPAEDRPAIYRKHRSELWQKERDGEFNSSVLERNRKRAVQVMARAANHSWPWLRAQLPPWGAFRLGISALGYTLFAAFMIFALLQTCSTESEPRRTPRSFPTPTTPQPTLPPEPFSKPIRLDLRTPREARGES